MSYIGNVFIRFWEHFLALFLPPKGFFLEPKEKFIPIAEPSQDLVDFAKKYHYFSTKQPLIGKVTKSKSDITPIQSLLHKMKDAPDHAVAEILTKVFAYRNLNEGVEIEVPFQKEMHQYRIDRVFDLWQHIPAFGLLSETEAPILLFRGTQFSPFIRSGRASIVADLDPKGPGHDLYNGAREEITNWLKKQKKPARTMGYSLGGALASFALILDAEYFSKTSPSYLFHSPGVSSDLLHKYEQMQSPPASQSFACLGDLVSKFGRLFGPTTILKERKLPPPITAHTNLLFAKPHMQKAGVHNRKENRCYFRDHYTIIHRSTSRLCYPIVKKLFL
ncbi:MAG: hypothetical protein SNF33_07715 [Candidatus Algichlamydia australiensis]|nr:hypothetical protein [Chlamydiales bacterium]